MRLGIVLLVVAAGCTPRVFCFDDANCPSSAPVCVAGACAVADEGEGEGEGDVGEGEGEGDVGEGEGEGEGEPGNCRVAGCAPELGCVDQGAVDVGTCQPAAVLDDCPSAAQLFAREDGAPWIWSPIFLDRFTGTSAAAYGCTGGQDAFMFSFSFLDDEDDVESDDPDILQVRSAGNTTHPTPTVAFSGDVGHIGQASAVLCANDGITDFAFALDDAAGNTSNAACIEP